MKLRNFIRKPGNTLEKGGRKYPEIQCDQEEPVKKCKSCEKFCSISNVVRNYYCCPHCGYHFRINSKQRINMILDEGSFTEMFSDLKSEDVINFPGYKSKLKLTEEMSGENEAVVCGIGKINDKKCAVFVMEPNFMMGSMGTVVGEKVTRIFEFACKERIPVIGYTVSGGARMQEGIMSLMQMAKTSAAVKRFSDNGLLYISVITDPTMGGVTASFAMEGDIILSEPGAMVGFAGSRVIEQVTRKKLTDEFQKSEFLLKHGFVDRIVHRGEQRRILSQLLRYHSY